MFKRAWNRFTDSLKTNAKGNSIFVSIFTGGVTVLSTIGGFIVAGPGGALLGAALGLSGGSVGGGVTILSGTGIVTTIVEIEETEYKETKYDELITNNHQQECTIQVLEQQIKDLKGNKKERIIALEFIKRKKHELDKAKKSLSKKYDFVSDNIDESFDELMGHIVKLDTELNLLINQYKERFGKKPKI